MPDTTPRRPRLRRAAILAGALIALIVVLAGAAVLLLPRVELAGFAAGRISASVGRGVTIESLRIDPGQSIAVTLRGARLANIEGGTEPDMARIERLDAVIEAWPLLRGAVVVRRLEAEGGRLLLERDGEGRGNWSFGPASDAPSPPPRAGVPVVLALALADGEIIIRTRSGRRLALRIDAAALEAPDSASPAALRADGAYNDAPLTLEAALGSFDQLHDADLPFPIALRLRSGNAVLAHEGTAMDPLNFDQVRGTTTLEGPSLGEILAVAGLEAGSDVPVAVAASGSRDDADWRFADLTGTVDGHAVSGPLVRFVEGPDADPDLVEATLTFEKLDLARFLETLPDGGGDDDGLLLPRVVQREPDPLFRGDLAAGEIAFRRLRGTDATLKVEIAPGRLTVETLALSAFGGRIEGNGTVTERDGEASLEAFLSGRGTTIDGARRAAGIEPVPLAGPFDLRASITGSGETLAQAEREARIVGVFAMQGGSIERELVEQVSTDVRALFRSNGERARILCLLAMVDIAGGRGDIAAARLSTTAGTVVASGRIDLARGTVDARIGSVAETTSGIALDVPVRLSGALADPSIATTEWPRAERARFSVASRAGGLPPSLREIAEANACYGAAR
ncbi:AsmA family protein [Elioraea rosea]|uniref:AsmA family protein n=1 Tax=Elioraea rosea TaxID=2492390 RepID=UPI001181E8BC|nr:AsmA family protein [Elioraea rosea]